jgi:hypothetical protein
MSSIELTRHGQASIGEEFNAFYSGELYRQKKRSLYTVLIIINKLNNMI